MWIEMFFIKFEGKIENIRGIAENIFNFTQEFNEKHWNPHFFFLLKMKKTVGKFFWESYLLVDIAFWNKYSFLRYDKKTPLLELYSITITTYCNYIFCSFTHFKCLSFMAQWCTVIPCLTWISITWFPIMWQYFQS